MILIGLSIVLALVIVVLLVANIMWMKSLNINVTQSRRMLHSELRDTERAIKDSVRLQFAEQNRLLKDVYTQGTEIEAYIQDQMLKTRACVQTSTEVVSKNFDNAFNRTSQAIISGLQKFDDITRDNALKQSTNFAPSSLKNSGMGRKPLRKLKIRPLASK